MLNLVRADNVLAVGAARALGLVRSDYWPLIAAHLIAAGADGPSLGELASLPRASSGWEVDQLLDSALHDAGVPPIEIERAGEIVARVLAQTLRQQPPVRDHAIVRALAELGPYHGYPSGMIAEAYDASEWLVATVTANRRSDRPLMTSKRGVEAFPTSTPMTI